MSDCVANRGDDSPCVHTSVIIKDADRHRSLTCTTAPGAASAAVTPCMFKQIRQACFCISYM